jgi:hypothetical protein
MSAQTQFINQDAIEDDWESYASEDVAVIPLVPIVSETKEDDEDVQRGSNIPMPRQIGISLPRQVAITPVVKENKKSSSGLELLAEKGAVIFRDPKIVTGKHFSGISQDVIKLRIFGELNTLWERKNVGDFLKSAISHYTALEKVTTTKSCQQELKVLTDAVDQLNGAISHLRATMRADPRSDTNYVEDLRELERKKCILEDQARVCAQSKGVSEKTSMIEKKNTAHQILRTLAGQTQSSETLHTLLLQKIRPEKYRAMIDERRCIAIVKEKQEEVEREVKRMRSRRDKITDSYSVTEKREYMEARELLQMAKFIPLKYKRYVDLVEFDPHFSFARELESKQVIKTTIKSAEHAYKVSYPGLSRGQCNVHNATGAWGEKIDTEKLSSIPDVPKVYKTVEKVKKLRAVVEDWDDDIGVESYDSDEEFR